MQRLPTKGNDTRWLNAAARLAARGRPVSHPNPAVGCLIVKDARVVGRGWTRAGGRPHAEAAALGEAGEEAKGATAFVTLEPCAHVSARGPACADLLREAGIARVVVGMLDPDPRTAGEGVARLHAAGIAVDIVTTSEVESSLDGYLTRAHLGRPFVTLKLAVSLDGQIATAAGESQWITGEVARNHVHSRRAINDAILVGGGTWRADQPRLNVRLAGLEQHSPRRVLLSRGIAPDGVTVINTPSQIDRLGQVQYLYVEGGAQTAGSFLGEDLVDRIELYRAPIVIGEGRSALGDIGLESLADAHGRWALTERRQLGSDIYEAYSRSRPEEN